MPTIQQPARRHGQRHPHRSPVDRMEGAYQSTSTIRPVIFHQRDAAMTTASRALPDNVPWLVLAVVMIAAAAALMLAFAFGW
jgi:hypothetical protein